MSASGRVSRGSPVQTAMRNCTRDEGRSFEAGSQVLASNRCKLLSSKAMVVSVAVNVGRISRRVRLREASASEPPMNCRKRIRRCQNRAVPIQVYSLIGSYVMATAEHREPYESRGSRTCLGARGGEIPPRNSTLASKTAEAVRPCTSAALPKADVNSPPWLPPLCAMSRHLQCSKMQPIR